MTVYVQRRLRCPSCKHIWQEARLLPKGSQEKPDPCPECSKKKSEIIVRPVDRSVQAGRLAAKAVDFTYNMAEKDYGITNLKDNVQNGEVSAIVPSIAPEVQNVMQERGGFYGGGKGVQSHLANHSTAMDLAAGARAERQSQGLKNVLDAVQPGMKKEKGVVQTARETAKYRHKI